MIDIEISGSTSIVTIQGRAFARFWRQERVCAADKAKKDVMSNATENLQFMTHRNLLALKLPSHLNVSVDNMHGETHENIEAPPSTP